MRGERTSRRLNWGNPDAAPVLSYARSVGGAAASTTVATVALVAGGEHHKEGQPRPAEHGWMSDVEGSQVIHARASKHQACRSPVE